MKKLRYFYFLSVVILISVIAISSCKNDKDNPSGPDLGSGNGLASGVVYDLEGSKLSGVTISIGEASAVTDSDGNFEITDASEGENIPVNISKEGYKSTQKLISINSKTEYYLEAALGAIQVTKTIPASGGEVSNNNFEINFNEGFVDENGDAYTGDIKVEATYFRPSDEKFLDAFPGRFEGERTDGSITMFESFGYIDVELFDNNGNKLNLADGSSASITLNLDNSISNDAPAEISIWYYDTDKSKWIEDGKAVKNNGKYEFEVSHFSAWNCDQPAETSELTGRVVDGEGNPLENATVTQRGIDYTGSFSTTTDEDGNFTLKVKSNSLQKIYAVYSGSTSQTLESVSKGVNEAKDLGEFVIDPKFDNNSYRGWYRVESNTGNDINSIELLKNNEGYFVAKGLYKFNDTEDKWQLVNDEKLNDSFVNNSNQESLLFVGENLGFLYNGRSVFKTSDGGNSWVEIKKFKYIPKKHFNIQFINKNIGYIYFVEPGVKYIDYTYLFKTENRGETWEKVDIDDKMDYSLMYFINEEIGFLTSHSKLLKTTDVGNSWSKIEHDFGISYNNRLQLFFLDENIGWAYSLDDNSIMYKTTDGGLSWEETEVYGIKDIHFINSSEGWAVGSKGIYFTSDGGNNWNLQKESPTTLYSIHMYDDQIGLAGGKDGILFRTETGGIE